jgi:hypothetical protein
MCIDVEDDEVWMTLKDVGTARLSLKALTAASRWQ